MSLAALVLATPIFGFALTPPADLELSLPVFAQVDATGESVAEAADDEGSPAVEAEDAPLPDVAAADEAEDAADEEPRDPSDLAAAIQERQNLAAVHRAFGIATWGAMLVTVVLGAIQYGNLYGFFGEPEDTPCVQGNAVFGQDQCWGEPWPHRIAAFTTTALYATTFVLSFVMPDPLDASSGDSGLGPDLRLHKDLRWVHLGGMIAQVLLGLAVGQNWFGLDRANDFRAQQALATVHQVIGLTTFGALTAAGAIMLF